MGPTGIGKSSVAAQYACAAALRSDVALFLMFGERRETWFAARAACISRPKGGHDVADLWTKGALHGCASNRRSGYKLLTDNVLLFRYYEHNGEVRQALSVFKRRGGPHERTIRDLRLVPSGIEVGPQLHEFRGC
jgi:hypothetical protein